MFQGNRDLVDWGHDQVLKKLLERHSAIAIDVDEPEGTRTDENEHS